MDEMSPDNLQARSPSFAGPIPSGDTGSSRISLPRFPLLELSPIQCIFEPLAGPPHEEVERLNLLAGHAPS